MAERKFYSVFIALCRSGLLQVLVSSQFEWGMRQNLPPYWTWIFRIGTWTDCRCCLSDI